MRKRRLRALRRRRDREKTEDTAHLTVSDPARVGTEQTAFVAKASICFGAYKGAAAEIHGH